MLKYLNSYLQPITVACMLFPAIAAVFTLPFVIRHYRKFGGIAIMRTVIVYSFILYCMCTFLLTVLPLPSREAVLAMPKHGIGWIPYEDMVQGMKKCGISFSNLFDAGAWKAFFKCSDFLQVLCNIVMTIPLGLYLRYYFKFTFRETVLMGFCASLFFEVTQYTGLYGIYPKAYRFTEMDDLINNTLGAAIGFLIEPLIAFFLPKRDEIDRISYKKGERVTFLRRVYAFIIDILFFNFIFALMEFTIIPASAVSLRTTILAWIGTMILYYLIIPCFMKGRTFGQKMLKLKIVSENGEKAKWRQVIGRNFLLYGIEYMLVSINGVCIANFISALVTRSNTFYVMFILGTVSFVPLILEIILVLRCVKKYNQTPHSHYSHTKEIAYGRKVMEKFDVEEAEKSSLCD